MQHSLEESIKEVKAIGAGLIRWLLTPTLAVMLRVPDTLSARFDFGTLSRGNCSLVWPTALVSYSPDQREAKMCEKEHL